MRAVIKGERKEKGLQISRLAGKKMFSMLSNRENSSLSKGAPVSLFFIYLLSGLFFQTEKNNFFSPEIFFSFTRGENVFLLLFCDFFFFPQSLSHIAFLCFFLVKVSRKKFTKK